MDNQYLEVNKQLWNNKVDAHVASNFYDVKGFLAGQTSLKEIELGLLGDIKGKSILHLQCHFGQDTISLARMGAIVTGVDLSDKSIAQANELAAQSNVDARFICTDVYSLPDMLHEQFDIVFTTYGTIGWLPDMDKWANVVARFMKPGGKFVFVEFHPVVWMFDEKFDKVGYNYFNEKPIITTQSGTYADHGAALQDEEIGWNHPLTEVLTALLSKGLTLRSFGEYDYSPYNVFYNMEESEPGRFRIKHLGNQIPIVYSIVATK